jgi:DNA polymerase III subunit alpha, Gram-positive type
MMDFLKDNEFLKLEKEYKFLSRAREAIEAKHGGLEKLTYVVFDFETTGLDPNADEIIEIGAVKVEGGEIKDVFNKLVKPTRIISQTIIDLTGITPEMLENEPPIKPIIEKFYDFIGDSILVAHNADFDTSFLRNNVKKCLGKDINNSIVCTVRVSRDLLPNLDNHKLHTIANYYKLDVVNRHRAIGDVELTYQIWLKFIQKLQEKKITSRKELEDYMAALVSSKQR